ncbi:MAG: glycine cleavage system protein GcvH [Thermoplasmata archaeon]
MSGSAIPDDRRYTRGHEWVRDLAGELEVGITDHAQSELTDIVFVNLPALGAPALAGASVLVLESVKTVADVYAPCDGTLSAVNTELAKHPDLVNKDPYGRGWIFRWKPTGSIAGLLSAAEYATLLGPSSA